MIKAKDGGVYVGAEFDKDGKCINMGTHYSREEWERRQGAQLFTPTEIEALKDMVTEWIGEGFTTPPYAPDVSSVIRKLGLSEPKR